jgi:hypothetical protein
MTKMEMISNLLNSPASTVIDVRGILGERGRTYKARTFGDAVLLTNPTGVDPVEEAVTEVAPPAAEVAAAEIATVETPLEAAADAVT